MGMRIEIEWGSSSSILPPRSEAQKFASALELTLENQMLGNQMGQGEQYKLPVEAPVSHVVACLHWH